MILLIEMLLLIEQKPQRSTKSNHMDADLHTGGGLFLRKKRFYYAWLANI
jgi:hypothetical protein